MATTMFFEQTIKDKSKPERSLELEIGRSSYADGENLIYIAVNGQWFLLDEETGRAFCEAVSGVGTYLGYDEP